MHFYVYYAFYSLNSHHVSAAIAVIFRVILLQEFKGTTLVSCVVFTAHQLKITILSVTII